VAGAAVLTTNQCRKPLKAWEPGHCLTGERFLNSCKVLASRCADQRVASLCCSVARVRLEKHVFTLEKKQGSSEARVWGVGSSRVGSGDWGQSTHGAGLGYYRQCPVGTEDGVGLIMYIFEPLEFSKICVSTDHEVIQ
jgi:hypothetical protein